MEESNDRRSNTVWLLFILLTILCIAQINISWAREVVLNPTGRDIELSSLLKISDSVLGQAQVTITADDEIRLPKDSTIALLSSSVAESALEKLQDASSETLSQEDFRRAGLELTFDLSSLECIISVPNELSVTRQISLAEDNEHFNYSEPSFFSGYVNVTASANETQTIADQNDRQSIYSARFESGLNAGSANFEYEATFENGSSQDSDYYRQGTRLNYDFPSQGTRLVLGDMFNAGKSFQDGTDILGIGITRDFTLIPTRNVRPKANQSFTLQRTSNVDVVIDGIVVQRLTLGAGSYNLSDIPLAQGTNDVELVITDSSGKTERIQFSVATGNDLLNSGEFEYSLMAGVPSEVNNNELDYQTDQKLIHGYLDVGVLPWLTLGLNGQKREDLYQYGGTALIASSLGVTELSASQSHHPTLDSGQAFRVAFDAEFDDNNPWQPQLSVFYEYQSENFAGVESYNTIDSPLNQTTHYASAFGAFYINDDLRAAMTVNYRSGTEDTANYWSVSPSLSGSFFSTPATWSARVNYQNNDVGSDEWNTSLTLSWPLSDSTRLVSRYNSEIDQAALDLTYQNNVGNTGGMSGYASVVTSRDSDADVDLGVNYSANRFQVIADHATRMESLNEDIRNHSTRLEVSSAIAFAGSSITVGRPVREAFAVVSKHPSLEENNIDIDPTLDGESARVYSHSASNVLIPDLVAYTPQLISYEVENLPPGYDLGDGAFWLKPGYKRGYQLEIGSDSVLTVMGTLLDRESGSPIPLIAGVATYLGSENQQPIEFFTNRNGLFAISGLRPGQYQLTLDTKEKQTVVITLDERSNVLIRLGELYVD